MKVKKGSVVWLIISILTAIACIALSIYQLINRDFDPLTLIILIFVGDAIFNCFEKKEKQIK